MNKLTFICVANIQCYIVCVRFPFAQYIVSAVIPMRIIRFNQVINDGAALQTATNFQHENHFIRTVFLLYMMEHHNPL